MREPARATRRVGDLPLEARLLGRVGRSTHGIDRRSMQGRTGRCGSCRSIWAGADRRVRAGSMRPRASAGPALHIGDASPRCRRPIVAALRETHSSRSFGADVDAAITIVEQRLVERVSCLVDRGRATASERRAFLYTRRSSHDVPRRRTGSRDAPTTSHRVARCGRPCERCTAPASDVVADRHRGSGPATTPSSVRDQPDFDTLPASTATIASIEKPRACR